MQHLKLLLLYSNCKHKEYSYYRYLYCIVLGYYTIYLRTVHCVLNCVWGQPTVQYSSTQCLLYCNTVGNSTVQFIYIINFLRDRDISYLISILSIQNLGSESPHGISRRPVDETSKGIQDTTVFLLLYIYIYNILQVL